MEEVRILSWTKLEDITDAYKAKTVKKWVREVFKRRRQANRSNSKQSVNSTRMSLNTISSLAKLGYTMNASKENFNEFLRASKERMITDQTENIPSNVLNKRTRNTSSLTSLYGKKSMNSTANLKIVKTNTLSGLLPGWPSSEFGRAKNSQDQRNSTQRIYSSMTNGANRPEMLKSTLPRPNYQDNNFNEKPLNTLNSSWDSSRNVDCSDLVLKGDVMPTLKRNSSAVEASHSTLKMVDMMTTQDSRASYKNNRYHMLEQNSGYLEHRESKNSPDLAKHCSKMSNLTSALVERYVIHFYLLRFWSHLDFELWFQSFCF